MKPWNVYLDTEVFTSEKFNLKTSKLAEIHKLATEGKIHLISSTLTVAECKKRIHKMVTAAAKVFKDKENRQALAILQHSSLLNGAAIWTVDKKAIVPEIIAIFDDFLKKSDVTILPLSGVSIESLFADYFAGNPPFGEGQKKDQFPDAAAMLALSKWCIEHKQKVHVVSEDGDLKGVCDANPKILICQRGLAEFLDYFNKHFKTQERLVEIVKKLASEKEGIIKKEVTKKFEWAGFVLIGEDGDVEDVEVDSISIDKTLLIAVEEEYAIAELTVTVRYTANVSYLDSSTGWYDNEDGRYYSRETVNKSIERDETFQVEVEFGFDADNPEDADVTVSCGIRDFTIDISPSLYDYK